MGYWCLHAWLCVKTPHDENIHWLMSKKAVAFAVAGYIAGYPTGKGMSCEGVRSDWFKLKIACSSEK
jgi:hypothetical protein